VPRVIRPVVRAFAARFEEEAGKHVRAGGHAVVWSSPSRARLVFAKPTGLKEEDLGYWSVLDMGRTRWSTVRSGPLQGLAVAAVPSDHLDLVRDRAARDSVHRGSTRAMLLDCPACAACCRNNHVELDATDVERFRRADRSELARPPYTRRAGEKLVLRLLRSKDCRHLQGDKTCGIYAIRPKACRTFPPGSEGCLFSREEELGVVDGAIPASFRPLERDSSTMSRSTPGA
jgi:Fe-S-cluster containining protein